MKKRRLWTTYLLLIVMLLASMVLALGFGSVSLTLSDLVSGLVGQTGYETEHIILFSIRLPRMLAALLAGVGLSVSGVILQNVMGNPLASPNTIGVNAGAGLAAIWMLSVLPTANEWLSVAAFVGAFLTAMLILLLSKAAGGGKATVILAGIACTSLFQAAISFISTLDTDVLSMYNAFSVGSFSGVELQQLCLPAILIFLSLLLSLVLAPKISALSLGDFTASSLGVRVTVIRTVALAVASMSAAAVISYAGLLGFVGLVVPHITRKLLGEGLRCNLCAAPLVGGILVILSDLAGRTLFAPGEVSVGIIMAFIGAPFFFILILRGRNDAGI